MSFNDLLLTIGMKPASRYTIPEVAIILGLTEHQVRTQIRKGNLIAIKGSTRRYVGVMHHDLATYFTTANGRGE
jgi:hypothetical protein